MTTAHLAPSLAQLRSELDHRWPHRDRRSDGWLGDAAHMRRRSDHDPNRRHSVDALDVDKDGIEPMRLVYEAVGDPRVNYVIFNRTIWMRKRNWVPHRYTGVNPHTKHVHTSILQSVAAENDAHAWFGTPVPLKPAVANAIANVLLREGSRGPHVVALQQALAIKPADGLFGPRTKAAVVRFQLAHHVPANGIVGGATIAALRKLKAP